MQLNKNNIKFLKVDHCTFPGIYVKSRENYFFKIRLNQFLCFFVVAIRGYYYTKTSPEKFAYKYESNAWL